MDKLPHEHSAVAANQQNPQTPPSGEVPATTPPAETPAPAAQNDDPGHSNSDIGGTTTADAGESILGLIEFQLYVDLYKYFLRISLSVSVFFLSVAGGLLTIFFNTQSEKGESLIATLIPPAKLILLATPFIISCVLTAAFGVGAWYWWFSTVAVNKKIKEKHIEVTLITRPFFHLLTFVLVALTFIFTFVMIMLGRIMAHYNIWFGGGGG